jgi:hypothetical protein
MVILPPTVVASGYFGYVGYHQFYLGVLGLQVVAFGFVQFVSCGCLAGVRVLLCVGRPNTGRGARVRVPVGSKIVYSPRPPHQL